MSLPPNIHILGIQGSGKGTQSALLVEKYSFYYLASGNLFRTRAAVPDPFGQEIASLIQKGKLLNDSYLVQTVTDALATHSLKNGVLGDGVIRTEAQYNKLFPIWKTNSLDEPLLIHLVLDEAIALERIKKRQAAMFNHEATAQEKVFAGKLAHRTDDNPTAIEERFSLFHQMTEPLIRRFTHSNRYIKVDANQSIELIFAEICNGINHFYSNLYVPH